MVLNRSDWKEDKKLKKDMSQYVIQNLRNMEILKYVARDFSCYDWSLPTLPRRMKHFSINYISKEVSEEDIVTAVNEELRGPGKMLGYCAMHIHYEWSMTLECHKTLFILL